VEGAHHTFKHLLQTRKGDLARVASRILFKRQTDESTAAMAREGIRTLSGTISQRPLRQADVSHPQPFTVRDLFAKLIHLVSHHALQAILAQLVTAERPGELSPCSRYHERVLGLPCAHVLRAAIIERRSFSLGDVAAYWVLRAADAQPIIALPLVRDPAVQIPRRRALPVGSSTRRDPSHFETGTASARRQPR